jgi:dTDP-4-dehydrorhamnose 3,5-epimerase
MTFAETPIGGCYTIQCDPVHDSRGTFFRNYDKRDFVRAGLQKEIVQQNISINTRKGTFRGMHMQLPPHAETKIIQCLSGKVSDIVLDVRKDSPSFLQWIAIELSAAACNMILIPEGCAHGFQSLEDHTVLLYMHTAYYNKQAECGYRYNDPMLKISLPLPPVVISERDHLHPLLDTNFKGIEL